MKHTAGYEKRRRSTAPAGRVRLNLQRRPKPEPEDSLDENRPGSLWKWVPAVALLHVLVIVGAALYYLLSSAPKPPDQFITLVPLGDTVKGTVGTQQAHKLGVNTPAAPSHRAAPPPPAPSAVAPAHPKVVTPPPVVQPQPTPIIKDNAPPIAPPKPVKLKPKPEKPKVKVDLQEVERTDAAATEAKPKPAKHHSRKPVKDPEDSQDDTDSSPDNTGLSKEQIAEKLGEKLNASGSHNAVKSGVSGAVDGQDNEFSGFYDLIKVQVQDEWNSPMTPTQSEPVVHIHVEPDGRVPAESVYLVSTSGDPAYDDAAVATVKRLGYLHEPLPHGCPPDIKIYFNPNP